MKITRRTALTAVAGFALAAQLSSAHAEDTLKIGLLATFEGAFTVLGEDGQRGAELALKQHDGMAGGNKIEFVIGSSDASPDSAIRAVRKLVEQDGVKIVIGPLSGDEGLAVKDYAKTQPDVVFVNGTSAAQDTTLRDPAENFFRFSTDGAQWMAGLGTYAYDKKGYRNVATVAEDYSFPYTQVFGFMAEFCKAGGHVPSKAWVPIGTKDYSSVIAGIPADIDAVYVALGGADGVNFLTQYEQAGGTAPLIGGSITVDQTRSRLEGQAEGLHRRHALGRPDRRYLGRSEVDRLRRGLQGGVPGRFPEPVALRPWLLRQHDGGAARPRRDQGRPVGWRRQASRGAGQSRVRHADRHGQPRQEPQCGRRHLHHRGG